MSDPLVREVTADTCVCGGTGLLTTLTEDGGNTGPFICPRCYVPAAERDRYRAALELIAGLGSALDVGSSVWDIDRAQETAREALEGPADA